MLVFRNPRPGQTDERSEDECDPEEAVRCVVTRILGQREVEHDEGGEDEEQHRRQRVAGPKLDAKVLPSERCDVGGVVHVSASSAVASEVRRPDSCVGTTMVRSRASSASSRSRSAAPASSSAENGSSRMSRSGSCKSVLQSARSCLIPREYEVTRPFPT